MLATTLKNSLPTKISKKPIDIVNVQTTQNPLYAPTGGTSRLEHVSRREKTTSCRGLAPGLGPPGNAMTEEVVVQDPGPRGEGHTPQGQEQGGKRSYLLRELRIKLYNEVISLRKSGLAYKRIIDEIWKRYGVRLSKSNISCWIRGLHTPYKGRRIPSIELLKPSEWLAYVIGVRLGDGYTREVKKRVKGYNHVFLGLKANDVEFAEMFAASVANVLDRHPPKPIYDEKRRWYMVEVESRTLYELLKKPVDLNRLKKHIEHCERCTAAFLRGFADSEGSVSKEGYISVSNTDRELLEYVKDLLQRLGIESTGPRPTTSRQGTIARFRNGSYKRRKDSYYIYIKANGNINFYKNVGFTIKRKQKRLENYIRRRQPNHPLPSSLPSFHAPTSRIQLL
jgi:intein-encoded DNA endonuclease-like protein